MLGFLRPTIAEGWPYALTAPSGLSGIVLLASRKTIVPVVLEFALGLIVPHVCVFSSWPTLIAAKDGHGEEIVEMNISNTWLVQ